jgi:hypothetical protein
MVRKRYKLRAVLALMAMAGLFGVAVPQLYAARFEGNDYIIDASVGNNFGGSVESTDYKMVASGGEAIIGNGEGGSYKLGAGYVAQLIGEAEPENSIQISVQPMGLNAYYQFDGMTGTVVEDASYNNNQGTAVNGPALVTGRIGSGLLFDGSSQYVSTTTAYANPTEFSLEAWLKTSTTSGGPIIGFDDADFSDGGAHDRVIWMSDDGKLHFGIGLKGASAVLSSAISYNDDQFHHVAVSMGTFGVKLYVDGELVDSSASLAAANFSGRWTVGGHLHLSNWPAQPSSYYFDGVIDEVKIFGRALSAKEVSQEYAAQHTGVPSALVFPDVTTGTSEIVGANITVLTDAPGYSLSIAQNHDLTKGVDTINPIAGGTIDTPVPWQEGITSGLGFSVLSGPNRPVKWGTNPNYHYAAVATDPTVFYNHSGLSESVKEQITVQYRLDVPLEQPLGDYQNVVTYTGTMIP